MKTKIRIAAALLSMSLILSFGIAGCGGTSGTAETPTDSAEASVSQSAAAEDSGQPSAEASAASSPSVYPLDEHYEFSVWTGFQTPLTSAVTGYDDWPVIQKLEENTNVTINWIEIPQNQAKDQFNLMIASGDYADMCRSFTGYYTGGIDDAYDQGIILDLTDLVADDMPNYNAALDLGENYRKDLTNSDGKMLYINTVQTQSLTLNGNVIRQDWLDDLGLSMPKTIDELEQVLLAFKSAYTLDSPVLLNQGNYSSLFAGTFGTIGLDELGNVCYAEDGKVVSSLTQDGFRDFIKEMNKWYKEGLFSPDFLSITSNPKDSNTIQMCADGETGVFNSGISIWTNLFDAATDKNYKLSAMPATVLSDGDLYEFADNYQIGGGSMCLFANCHDPDVACKFLDYLYGKEGADLMAYGIEGDSFDYDAQGLPEWNMDVLQQKADENGVTPSTIAEYYYGIKGNFVCLSETDALFSFFTDDMVKAKDVYNDASQYAEKTKRFSNYQTLTPEESTQISTVKTDIATYANTQVAKFITGDADVDAGWDDFVKTINDMGMDQVVQVYQQAYDRYVSK